jgi:hypothetical protein
MILLIGIDLTQFGIKGARLLWGSFGLVEIEVEREQRIFQGRIVNRSSTLREWTGCLLEAPLHTVDCWSQHFKVRLVENPGCGRLLLSEVANFHRSNLTRETADRTE